MNTLIFTLNLLMKLLILFLSFLPSHSIKRKTQINPKIINASIVPLKAGILKKLSEKLNCEEINISQSGGSNDRIFRTTFDWIQSNKEKVKDTLFVVGLTTINRVDLYSKHDNRYIPAQPFYSGESIKLIAKYLN